LISKIDNLVELFRHEEIELGMIHRVNHNTLSDDVLEQYQVSQLIHDYQIHIIAIQRTAAVPVQRHPMPQRKSLWVSYIYGNINITLPGILSPSR